MFKTAPVLPAQKVNGIQNPNSAFHVTVSVVLPVKHQFTYLSTEVLQNPSSICPSCPYHQVVFEFGSALSVLAVIEVQNTISDATYTSESRFCSLQPAVFRPLVL